MTIVYNAYHFLTGELLPLEAAGIEPASNNDANKASTGLVCFHTATVSKTDKHCHGRPPNGFAGSPKEHRSSSYPALLRPDAPAGERRQNGYAVYYAASAKSCLALVGFGTFYEVPTQPATLPLSKLSNPNRPQPGGSIRRPADSKWRGRRDSNSRPHA